MIKSWVNFHPQCYVQVMGEFSPRVHGASDHLIKGEFSCRTFYSNVRRRLWKESCSKWHACFHDPWGSVPRIFLYPQERPFSDICKWQLHTASINHDHTQYCDIKFKKRSWWWMIYLTKAVWSKMNTGQPQCNTYSVSYISIHSGPLVPSHNLVHTDLVQK